MENTGGVHVLIVAVDGATHLPTRYSYAVLYNVSFEMLGNGGYCQNE